MKGRRRPPQNQVLSLMKPTITWPRMPASGPAAHTRPISSILRWYLVESSQLSAEIWMQSAKPMAVAGKLVSA
jgi:hypothetical protein